MTFKEWQKAKYGYECITNLWELFSLAEQHKVSIVKEVFKKAFEVCKQQDMYKELTELAIVLNHKCWQHYHANNINLSKTYSTLYGKVNRYAWKTLKGDEIEYYYRITD